MTEIRSEAGRAIEMRWFVRGRHNVLGNLIAGMPDAGRQTQQRCVNLDK